MQPKKNAYCHVKNLFSGSFQLVTVKEDVLHFKYCNRQEISLVPFAGQVLASTVLLIVTRVFQESFPERQGTEVMSDVPSNSQETSILCLNRYLCFRSLRTNYRESPKLFKTLSTTHAM